MARQRQQGMLCGVRLFIARKVATRAIVFERVTLGVVASQQP